ncbi:MAG: hypothetical protein WD942_01905 [Dehalococcoidia bacterium]
MPILGHWTSRLASHFEELAADRGADATPLFSLEHGLTAEELNELTDYLSESLSTERLRVESQFLPWVVHAAEVGYKYEGHEFWRSFGESMPGWEQHGDRGFLRRCFRRFAEEYRGVVPTGSFARHFSIIAWPIRHALLPKDLQLQFARTLFELRHRFETGADHLTPELVGRQVSAGAQGKSGRFARFCEDHRLVGEIATAVLVGGREGGDGESIHAETLERVVRDIEAIRDARTFLDRARAGYRKGVLFAGGRRPPQTPSGEATLDQRLRVYLRRSEEDRWSIWVRLPHIHAYDGSASELRSALRRTRVGLRGQNDTILGARLLYPNAVERLDSWPGPGPLLMAPDNQPVLRDTFEKMGEVPSGPPWLFKLSDSGDAQLLTSNAVRPGSEYVVFTDKDDPPMEEHLTLASVQAEGIHVYHVSIPRPIPELLRFRIERLGLALAPQVKITPVGLVPPSWDHEGVLEVLSTEPCLLSFETDEELRRILFRSGDQQWEVGAEGLSAIVSLGRFPPGRTNVDLVLAFAEHGRETRCEMEIHSRVPRVWSDDQAAAGAVLLETSPPEPTLEEFWSAETQVWLYGPRGTTATVSTELRNYDGEREEIVLADSMRLPMTPSRFQRFRAEMMRKDSFTGKLDYSEQCDFFVRSIEAGGGRISLEREATALRWAVSFERDAPRLALIDNSDSDSLSIRYYSAESPFTPSKIELVHGGASRRLEVRPAMPGLYVAENEFERIGSVVPPAGSSRRLRLSDLRSDLTPPRLERSQRGISSAISTLADWAAGRPCGNRVQAESLRRKVLMTMGEALLSSVGGHALGGVVRVFRGPGSAERALSELKRTAGSRGWLKELEDQYEAGGVAEHADTNAQTIAAASELLVRCPSFKGATPSLLRGSLQTCGAALHGHPLSEPIDPSSFSKRILDDASILAASTYLLLRVSLDAG